MPSDIQVFVRWKEQAIFAGEDVECTITFKNVAAGNSSSEASASQKHYRRGSRPSNGVVNGANYSPQKSSLNPFNFGNRRPPPPSPLHRHGFERSHRATGSLSSPLALSHSFPPALPERTHVPGGHKHKRSVSIISGGDPDLSGERHHSGPPTPKVGGRSHARSASFQVFSRNNSYGANYQSATRPPVQRLSSADSPSSGSMSSFRSDPGFPRPPVRSQSEVSSPVPRKQPRRPLPLPTDFKFPQAPPPTTDTQTSADASPNPTSNRRRPPSISSPPRKNTPTLEPPSRLVPATKVLSDSSVDGSTRSSMEFYSMSNNSTETLESDYVGYPVNRTNLPLRHRRHYSNMEPAMRSQNQSGQSLLMGYAQISASFTVDGALINQNLFEEVKRKGVMGVPNTRGETKQSEKPRSGGGFWGTLGLNTIGESINELLSNGELDGLRDMRGVSSSQSIPLLSTPQSLLFVDLRLNPGEERSFSFSFTLPKGLPASHRGKAIKISYDLVIGTQRAINPTEPQRVQRVNIPFRVLSGVDAQGGVLGHDLMRPYVLLRDEARVKRIEDIPPRPAKEKSFSAKAWSSAPEFLSYVDEILDKRLRKDSLNSVTTPLETVPSHENDDRQLSCKDVIDFAILRSNQSSTSDRSANRFEITRNGRRIAVIVLNRPSHRLGETVVATIDFSDAALPCYSIRGSLETTEKVSPTIALRSSASITRATRKIHATCFESTLFSTRVVFAPAIPVSCTPTIITSGVNLEWELRFEFVTSSLHEDEIGPSGANLLETVEQDDRGTVFASHESVPCESFEVAIPLTVYGGSVLEPPGEELQGIPI